MKIISQILLVIAAITLTSCATHRDVAHVSLGYTQNPGRISNSTGFRTGELALAVASRLFPEQFPLVRELVLQPRYLASGDFQSTARKMNHFEAWMSALEATDETEV